MHQAEDTIAAVATPPGRGGVGIIRVSGSRVLAIATALLGQVPVPRQAQFHRFRDGSRQVIDEGLVLYFSGPASFTGEDVLELHGHGGPMVLDLLLRRVLELGARAAHPGEFTQRAFLNDKLDLAQAEAVADLIEAGTHEAARAALGSLQGVFSHQVHDLVEGLIHSRVFMEAAMDFPDEEVDFLADSQIVADLMRLRDKLRVLVGGAMQGRLLRDGMTVVIAGRPNAGKSSLLNRLAGREAAIVTDVPGTTRDVLREQIGIDGMPLHVIDTAGLRDSSDRVEQEGIRRAWKEIAAADRILLLVDDRTGVGPDEAAWRRQAGQTPITLIRNKIDLSGQSPDWREGEWGSEVLLSAKTGQGLDLLVEHLKTCMGYRQAGEGVFMARRRHLEALERAGEALDRAIEQLTTFRAAELAAEELRLAQEALAAITGEFTSDDLLGRIFSSFCIGK